MMRSVSRHLPPRRLLFAAVMYSFLGVVRAEELHVVSDIRVDGLRRIAMGTVLTYLPIERGDTVDSTKAAAAVRALYKTGFFEDIRLDRQGDILVITVQERPAINTLKVTGNKDIQSEDLLKGLNENGMAEGDTFNRLVLDKMGQELTRQYQNRGKYNVEITPTVSRLDRNRVDVEIAIKEGKAARIQHINLVGNDKFADEDIIDTWESAEHNWLSWYRRDDQYSREKLSGDLEKLNNYYLDRGYVDFNIDSTQVAISADRTDMFITADITEGDQYKVSSVQLTGDTVLPKVELEKLVLVSEGQIFSRRLLELTSDSVVATLGNIGYAFAQVNPVPDIDRESKTVGISLQVVPGPRVNVRQISFKGNTRTNEEVLRRELRQLEASWYSQAAIDRSKIRLQRLGLFESVEVDTKPVPDRNDQVDVLYTIKETSSGEFQAGLGYSQDDGITATLSLTQRNFLGTGRTFSANVTRSSTSERYGFTVAEPYLTDLGVGFSYGVNWSKTRYDSDDESSYDSQQGSVSTSATIPLSENNALTVGLGWDTRTLYLYDGYYPPSYLTFLDNLGTNRIDSWTLRSGWSIDTRNDLLTPTGGAYYALSGEVALPGSDVTYYKLDADLRRYWRMGPTLLLARGEFGFGGTYGDGDQIGYPFYRGYYAGGVGSLRGFRDNTLGPCEYVTYYNDCRPTGGRIKTLAGLEVSMPGLFGKAAHGTQLAWFLDAGNVFAGTDTIDGEEVRASTGLSLRWRSPMGPISISYGLPIRQKEDDEIERLQFTFGSQF
ncbi:outer membrane protein assembly factor BamA [Lysobacter yangpyeongensis]|uniref:Outer membrane protein assembly factor BamA n=1 Tax=Lysobacter yangpyeongensis TaxID=346182 RepID=A0ABW0SIS1_9GAMM